QLILSKDLVKTEGHNYVTLSYCWGSANDTARTTKQNIAQRLKAISIGNLPKTIQDTIRVMRALGVKFLWVDALCIVQVQEGSNKDWERELRNMGKIYRHSVLTIAASGAKSSEGGLFHLRRAARWPVENYYLENDDEAHEPGGTGGLLKPSLPIWELAVNRSALARRGWVLQEQMLASRTLFWTQDGLFWRCAELTASEYEEEMEKRHRLPTLQALAQDIVEFETTRRTRSVWTKLLEEFSQKMLTVATDRLPAVEGLGTDVSRLTGKKMVKGIWSHNLVHELAWMADFMSSKPARLPNMPSWSWASVDAKL
ncbi:HET-domain-containing protein, partial [Macroventuria anomochaeta]